MSNTLARAHPVSSDESAVRVGHIADLMRTGEWEAVDQSALAAHWGISPSRLRALAAEAGRLVRGLFDTDAARAEVNALLDEARRVINEVTGPEKAKLLQRQAELVAKLSGCAAPTRLALSRGIDELPAGWEHDDERKDH